MRKFLFSIWKDTTSTNTRACVCRYLMPSLDRKAWVEMISEKTRAVAQARPTVDMGSTARNEATQLYREAQEEISRLDKMARTIICRLTLSTAVPAPGIWGLRRELMLQNETIFYFNGTLVDREQLGNITFGYLGTA